MLPLILAISLTIWVHAYALVGSLALVIAWLELVIAWCALVIIGRYPRRLSDFIAGVRRFVARFTADVCPLSDPYPAFGRSGDPAYPMRTGE